MRNYFTKINQTIPLMAVFTLPCQGGEAIGECISQIYTVSLSLVGIVAFVQIVWGGFLVLTSAGNTSKYGEAMNKIKNAILGIVLLFSSYLILNTINPDLVNFNFNFEKITKEEEFIDSDQISRINNFGVTQRAVSFAQNPELDFKLSVYASKTGLAQQCADYGEQMEVNVFLKKPPLSGTDSSVDIQAYSNLAGNWNYYGDGKVVPFDFKQKLQESVLVEAGKVGVTFPANSNLEYYATFSCGRKELNRSVLVTVNMGP